MLLSNLGFIGAGRMATALAEGFVRANLVRPEAILASDPSESARLAFGRAVPGATIYEENTLVASHAQILLLAVKPQQIDEVLATIRGVVRGESLVVSIAAGTTLARLAQGLPPQQRIIRVMPNTPCLIGRGASCFSRGIHATKKDAEVVSRMFSAVGAAFEVDESLLDAVTGLSGSGPAFVYTMIEALTEGGVAAGLPSELSSKLAALTVSGSAEMVLQTGEAPAVLRERVTSPGGTTQAGLAVLDSRGFRAAVREAVLAAARRSAELGRPTC